MSPQSAARIAHMRHLVEQLQSLENRLREGGGAAKIERQHRAGKLTARERISRSYSISARASSKSTVSSSRMTNTRGQAHAGGERGRNRLWKRSKGGPPVIVANDATVKAGAWWPETITKILRAQEITMRNRVPIVYLVDSAGVNLPYQDGIFPGQYGAGRIFYYNSILRRKLRVPQIAAVMGPCIAGGAYLPALSDVLIMVDKTSFMGLGGPNLVKGATGQSTDQETLGGARMHTTVSGVAHYLAHNDTHCLELIRERFRQFPEPPSTRTGVAPAKSPNDLYEGHCPPIIANPIRWKKCCCACFDGDAYIEFQPEFAPEMLCLNTRLAGRPGAVIATRRGFHKSAEGPRIGGIVYTDSARKVAYFVEQAERAGTPIIYVQDVSGFMIGIDAESSGIIRAGAEMVESMSCATVPKIVVTVSHASGAGYYAMAGQGFDPNFTFGWPTARIGVMEGDSGGPGSLLRGTGEAESHRSGVPKTSRRRSRGPRPIMSGGSMPVTPPRAAIATR